MNIRMKTTVIEVDGRVSECMDPEGNGVSSGKVAGGGPGPQSEEQDKQLICNSGGDETPMEEPGGQDGSDAASRTITHRVGNIVNE
jgi:hypothetical protein